MRPMSTVDAALARCIVFPGEGHAIGQACERAGAVQRIGKEMGTKFNYWAIAVTIASKIGVHAQACEGGVQRGNCLRLGAFPFALPGALHMIAAWPKIAPWLLLVASNVFMTFAWYGHLKNKSLTLPLAILSSWLIALPEYMLAVPANRLGHQVYSTAQLKTGQEAITLIVFTLFSYFYLGEAMKWTTFLGFALIVAGAGLVFFFK
jgi:uncharacterized protein (DUF486 family)